MRSTSYRRPHDHRTTEARHRIRTHGTADDVLTGIALSGTSALVTGGSRVVAVASAGHFLSGIRFVEYENPPGVSTDRRVRGVLDSDRAAWYNHVNLPPMTAAATAFPGKSPTSGSTTCDAPAAAVGSSLRSRLPCSRTASSAPGTPR